MRIETRREGSTWILSLAGELDASNYTYLVDAARDAKTQGARAMIIDLGRLTYMGSAGLVALHSVGLILAGIEPPGGEAGFDALLQYSGEVPGHRFREVLKLASVPPLVERVLSRTGMAALFELHPDAESAVASVG